MGENGKAGCTHGIVGRNGKTHWLCKGTSLNGEACNCWIPLGRRWCDFCGHMPPAHVTSPELRKGGGKGSNGGKVDDAKSGRKGNGKGKGGKRPSAHDQRTKELEDKLAKVSKEAATARKAQQVAEAKAKAAEARGAEATAVCEMVIDDNDEGESTPDQKIQAAQEKLRYAREAPDGMRAAFAIRYDEYIAQLEQELEDAKASKREGKSLKVQLEQAELYQERAAKRAEKARASLQESEQQMDALLQKMELQKAEVETREEQCLAAKATVSALATRMAEQLAVEPPPTAAAEHTKHPPEGFVSIAFAEEKWAEREAQVAEQIAQLQALVTTYASTQGESLSDVANASGDVENLEDDEVWNTVERGKRKAVLGKQRDALATKVRTSLAKVSGHASPFKK